MFTLPRQVLARGHLPVVTPLIRSGTLRLFQPAVAHPLLVLRTLSTAVRHAQGSGQGQSQRRDNNYNRGNAPRDRQPYQPQRQPQQQQQRDGSQVARNRERDRNRHAQGKTGWMKWLTEPHSAASILEAYEYNKDTFTSADMAFAISRISFEGRRNRKLTSDPRYLDLVKQLQDALPKLSALDVVRFVTGIAKAGYQHPGLLDAIAQRAMHVIHQCDHRGLANIVWAYSAMRHPQRQLFDELAVALLKQPMSDFNSQDIGNISWGYAKLGHRSPELFNMLAKVLLENRPEFTAQGIGNTAWAFTELGLFSEPVFTRLAELTVQCISKFNPQDISNASWAFAAARQTTSVELFRRLHTELERKVRFFAPVELATTALAFSKVNYDSPAFYATVRAAAASQWHRFNVTNLAAICSAFAKAGHLESLLTPDLERTLLNQMPRFTGQNVASVCWALTTARVRNERLLDAIAQHHQQNLATFPPHCLAILAWAYSEANYMKNEAFWATLVECITNYSARDYAQASPTPHPLQHIIMSDRWLRTSAPHMHLGLPEKLREDARNELQLILSTQRQSRLTQLEQSKEGKSGGKDGEATPQGSTGELPVLVRVVEKI